MSIYLYFNTTKENEYNQSRFRLWIYCVRTGERVYTRMYGLVSGHYI